MSNMFGETPIQQMRSLIKKDMQALHGERQRIDAKLEALGDLRSTCEVLCDEEKSNIAKAIKKDKGACAAPQS